MEAETLGTIPWDPQTQRPGIRDHEVHRGRAEYWIQPNDTDGDQYHLSGIFS